MGHEYFLGRCWLAHYSFRFLYFFGLQPIQFSAHTIEAIYFFQPKHFFAAHIFFSPQITCWPSTLYITEGRDQYNKSTMQIHIIYISSGILTMIKTKITKTLSYSIKTYIPVQNTCGNLPYLPTQGPAQSSFLDFPKIRRKNTIKITQSHIIRKH